MRETEGASTKVRVGEQILPLPGPPARGTWQDTAGERPHAHACTVNSCRGTDACCRRYPRAPVVQMQVQVQVQVQLRLRLRLQSEHADVAWPESHQHRHWRRWRTVAAVMPFR
ncbi:hypothetical protein XbrCFBP1976_04280 [Xanthomonas bromi]|uniref:Uncharacterized protein n=1 Tax=Xanthomonas bromi TaxID=56449 RepID=A0ABX5BSC0_9XANT|nr:hypothetical protein XbrCFBP1976_04280 [Xanthomonas bromi]